MYAPLPCVLQLNKENAIEIEEATREQNACERWHAERKKRLTASKFYELMKRKKITEKYITSVLKPSTFTSAPTSYGIANESKAKKLYVERQGNHVHDSGLCINPAFPFLGASPDGKVCDKGVCGILEVKCPYQARDMTIQQAIESIPRFCLCMIGDSVKLEETHAYYYQIQGQLMITGASFCDFVVFTRKDIFVQRIRPNTVFINDMLNSLCRIYFTYFHDKIDF
ncbi:hypothetical protein FSP39_021680 [Pinctada imbricata]|uniref:YqaJ viral recombinase domain-containing protein n=1 Tax=Pinctada imbricata TaxID=66713 RepID=A0AA88YTV8_PINIB|nr:hypothetical protein FSP39_021680 [Pinctada imbricata]